MAETVFVTASGFSVLRLLHMFGYFAKTLCCTAQFSTKRFDRLNAACLVLMCLSTPLMAQDFSYKPVNPSFGGDSFNSSHLLSLAERQNMFVPGPSTRNPISNTNSQLFERQIQSALLSRISAQIVDEILGETASEAGNFSIGGTQIDFERVDGIIAITISDDLSGGSTLIEIPVPDF